MNPWKHHLNELDQLHASLLSALADLETPTHFEKQDPLTLIDRLSMVYQQLFEKAKELPATKDQDLLEQALSKNHKVQKTFKAIKNSCQEKQKIILNSLNRLGRSKTAYNPLASSRLSYTL